MLRVGRCVTVVLGVLLTANASAGENASAARDELIGERNRLGQEAGQLRARGQLDEAIQRVRRTVEIERKVSGPEHPEVAVVLKYLSALLQEKDDWAAAIGAAEQVVAIYRAAGGDQHWKTVSAENEMATLRAVAGRSPQDRQRFRASAEDLELSHRLRGIGLFTPAETAAKRALAAREPAVGHKSVPVAECLVAVAQTLSDNKRPQEAAPLLAEANETLRDALGAEHPDRLVYLHLLGRARRELGELDEARRLIEEAWRGRRKTSAPDAPVLRERFDELLGLYAQAANAAVEQDDISQAVSLRTKQLSLCIEFLGADASRTREAKVESAHAERIAKLSAEQRRQLRELPRQLQRAKELMAQQKAVEALSLVDRTAQDVDGLVGIEDPLWADCYARMTELAEQAKQLDVAEQFATIVREHRTSVFGARHPRTLAAITRLADVQLAVANQLGDGGKLNERHAALQRALSTLTQTYGREDWRVTDGRWRLEIASKLLTKDDAARRQYEQIMTTLAETDELRSMQLLAAATARLQTAATYFEQNWNGRHPRYAECLHSLGVLAKERGDYAEAEPLLRHAAERYVAILGPKHPKLALTWTELAHLHQQVADFDSAERLFQQAAEVLETADGQELELARCLQGLGQCYLDTGELTPAEPLLRHALTIRLRRLGPDHADAAESWNSLGSFYRRVQSLTIAEELLRQAASVWRKLDKPLSLARCLDNLAGVLVARGDAAGAILAAREAQQLFSGALGSDHLDTIINRFRLAQCLSAAGQVDEAASLFQTALTQGLGRWEQAAVALSSRQRLNLAAQLRGGLDRTVLAGLQTRTSPDSLYAAVLRYKGSVLERENEDRRQGRELIRAGDESMAALTKELQHVNQRFVERLLMPPEPQDAEQARTDLGELFSRRTQLEIQRAQQSRGQTAAHPQPDEISRSLPEDVVLVDFYHAGRDVASETDNELLAFVSVPGKATQVVRFGAAAPIHQAIGDWRTSFGLSADGGYCPAAMQLRQLVWDRLPQEVLHARVVLLVPEGPLARFPWAALPGSQPQKYLVEEQLVAVLPSAQVLPRILKASVRQRPPATALVMGDIDFGETPAGSHGQRPQWRSLGGTARELDDLEKTLDEGHTKATVLRHGDATESRFRQEAASHRIVHLATHGFFDAPDFRRILLQATPRGPGGSFGLSFGRDYAALEPELLSGVVLAQANRWPAAEGQDGLLTALELGDLDLGDVDLVTVSACESGLGDMHPTEGSLGLTRALQAAGVRTCVTTLWQVDDAATAELMSEFYRTLIHEKVDALEALQRAQRAILRRSAPRTVPIRRGLEPLDPPAQRRVGAPYYWAAFVLSGDWR